MQETVLDFPFEKNRSVKEIHEQHSEDGYKAETGQ
jgi:hypothetical protein